MFLTPDSVGMYPHSRRFFVHWEYWYLFMGAIGILTEEKHWEQFGTVTPAEAAEYFRLVFEGYSEDDMIGTIVPYITAAPPASVLPCDGTTYDQADYPALAAAIDPMFRDDIAGTFTPPNLSGRTLIGDGVGAGLTSRALGDVLGAEQVQLTVAQLASHTHVYSDAGLPETPVVVPGEFPVNAFSGASDTLATGGDEPHENMQPSFVVHYGVYWR